MTPAATEAATEVLGGREAAHLVAAAPFAEEVLVDPLGDPKRTPDFYELVVLQHGRLTRRGDPNPSATMAEISGVALSTAQGWVTRPRARGLLPPGRQGRAG